MSEKLNGPQKNQPTQGSQSISQVHELLEGLGYKSDKLKHQAHGLTVAEMQELRLKQAEGEKPDMIEANKNSNYKIAKHEQHLVHVLLEVEKWNKGTKLSKPQLKKFYPTDFDVMSKSVLAKGEKNRPANAFGHYDKIEVIHDPRFKGKSAKKEEVTEVSGKSLKDMTLEELREKLTSIGGEYDATDTEAQIIAVIEQVEKPA